MSRAGLRRKEPWFKFFSGDYLCDPDVDALPLDAQAVLVRMWCVCNQNGNIPDNPEEIARLTRCKPQIVSQCYSQCKSFFRSQDGCLYSARMEAEKAKSEIARINASKRYDKDVATKADANSRANGNAQKARESERQNPKSKKQEETLALTADAASEPCFIALVLNDKSEYPIVEAQLTRWASHYPAIDVRQELRSYAAWAEANPTKRKTRSGILRSVNLWLLNAQKQSTSNSKGENRGKQRIDSNEEAARRAIANILGEDAD